VHLGRLRLLRGRRLRLRRRVAGQQRRLGIDRSGQGRGDDGVDIADGSRQLAYDMAVWNAGQGNFGEAAAICDELGFAAIELSGGQMAGVLDLANAAMQQELDLAGAEMQQEAIRAAEDAAPLPRSASTEDRLATAYGRIGRGTYGHRMTELANPAGATLAQGGVTGQATCGVADDLGYCMSPHHDAGCGSYAGPDVSEALRDVGAYAERASRPWLDSHGRIWHDQATGSQMTLLDHVEAATGERLGDASLFESGHGRRPLATPEREARWGDPDDPRHPGRDLHGARSLTQQLGLDGGPDPARERARVLADPRRAQALLSVKARTGDGNTETARERGERLRQSRQARAFDNHGIDYLPDELRPVTLS
jgi:hypothetical protein